VPQCRMAVQPGSRRPNASSTSQIVDTTRRHDCPGGNPPRRPVARSVTVYRTTKVDNVDALLLPNQDGVLATVGQSHRPVPVAQGSRDDIHAVASHRGELRHPEPVPPCVVRRFRETRVEADLARRPAIARADRPTQCVNVVVGIVRSKAARAAWKRFWPSTNTVARLTGGSARTRGAKITPPEAFRRVQRGGNQERVDPQVKPTGKLAALACASPRAHATCARALPSMSIMRYRLTRSPRHHPARQHVVLQRRPLDRTGPHLAHALDRRARLLAQFDEQARSDHAAAPEPAHAVNEYVAALVQQSARPGAGFHP